MRILFLTSELPCPPESGATIKTLSVLEYLRPRHDLRVLCFHRRPLTPEQEQWAAAAGVQALPLNRPRSPLNLLRSYLAGVPLSIQRNRSRRMARLVADRLAEDRPEAVFVDGWLMAGYLPDAYAGLRLLHQHNAEHLLWRRQAQIERNPVRRLLLRLEYRRVRAYEARILPRFDVVYAVSEEDRLALASLPAVTPEILLLPNLPQRDLLHRRELSFESTEPLVFYFGTLSWQPNVEGLEFVLRHVWPLVRRQAPAAAFAIAGRGAPPALRRLAERTEGVELIGPVDDGEPWYSRARVFLEATRTGGGTRLKVLNALARGLPAVVSSQAAEGLAARSGEHLLVADGPVATARAVLRLLDEPQIWTALSRNGRRLITECYLPEVAYSPLDQALSRAGAGAFR